MNSTRANKLSGIMLMALFSFSAFYIADLSVIKKLSLSPLIIGIILGMIYANSLRNQLPQTWVPGILFCSKTVLRTAIIFYGFRLTLQNVLAVGTSAIVVDLIIVSSVLTLGYFVGKVLKLDPHITTLCSSGSAICGAAAVLGTEPVLKSQPHKAAIAVSTVVIFGTISMFLYPALYRAGVFNLSVENMGIYTGSTLHEVAHVVGAGNAMNNEIIAQNSIIVKMIRVILLAPFLLGLSFFVGRKERKQGNVTTEKSKISIPWFAFGFLLVIGFNSFNLIPENVVYGINKLDDFALTMAMVALGAESNFEKFKKAGFKPFILTLIIYLWLVFGGYYIAKYVPTLF